MYVILSILVPIKYTLDDATDWVRSHGYIVRKIETTDKYHRFRQHTTKYAKDRGYDTIRTIPIGSNDVMFIVAYPHTGIGQLRLAHKETLHGAGISEEITGAFNWYRTSYSSAETRLINRYGSTPIVAIRVGRTPLSLFLTSMLNAVSFGEFNRLVKKSPYDKLFHLFCLITLETGATIMVEKASSINMKTIASNYNPKGVEWMDVTIGLGFTLKIILDKTQNIMGNDFFKYDALRNNCQRFVRILLESNGLLTQNLQLFIEQDVASIFKDYNSIA
jgi:hypothetical protein